MVSDKNLRHVKLRKTTETNTLIMVWGIMACLALTNQLSHAAFEEGARPFKWSLQVATQQSLFSKTDAFGSLGWDNKTSLVPIQLPSRQLTATCAVSHVDPSFLLIPLDFLFTVVQQAAAQCWFLPSSMERVFWTASSTVNMCMMFRWCCWMDG